MRALPWAGAGAAMPVLPLVVLLHLFLLCPVNSQFKDDFDDEGMAPSGFGDEDDMEDDVGGGGFGGGFGGGGHGYLGDAAPGALKLDSLTFDKVVGSEGWATLVKFDKFARWTRDKEVEEHWRTLCGQAHEAPNFLAGEVQVQANDDAEDSNDDLRRRFGLTSDQYPVFLLFKGDPKTPLRYSGAKTVTDMSVWLRKNGVKIPAMGTIAELDMIAARVSAAGAVTEADVAEAQKLGENEFKGDARVAVYVKIMRSLQSKGGKYIATETQRVQKVLKGQLSAEKRKQLQEKRRILSAFHQPATKDEL